MKNPPSNVLALWRVEYFQKCKLPLTPQVQFHGSKLKKELSVLFGISCIDALETNSSVSDFIVNWLRSILFDRNFSYVFSSCWSFIVYVGGVLENKTSWKRILCTLWPITVPEEWVILPVATSVSSFGLEFFMFSEFLAVQNGHKAELLKFFGIKSIEYFFLELRVATIETIGDCACIHTFAYNCKT